MLWLMPKTITRNHTRTASSPLPLGVIDVGAGRKMGIVMSPVKTLWVQDQARHFEAIRLYTERK